MSKESWSILSTLFENAQIETRPYWKNISHNSDFGLDIKIPFVEFDTNKLSSVNFPWNGTAIFNSMAHALPNYDRYFDVSLESTAVPPYEEKETILLEEAFKEIKEIVKNEQIEYGYTSTSDRFLQNLYQNYPNQFGAIIQGIYLKDSSNTNLLISLLKGVSSLPYKTVSPYGQIVALAALSNVNDEVKEAGIRAFEKWESPEGVEILENVRTSWDWLESYRLSTIEYLRSC